MRRNYSFLPTGFSFRPSVVLLCLCLPAFCGTCFYIFSVFLRLELSDRACIDVYPVVRRKSSTIEGFPNTREQNFAVVSTRDHPFSLPPLLWHSPTVAASFLSVACELRGSYSSRTCRAAFCFVACSVYACVERVAREYRGELTVSCLKKQPEARQWR